MKNDTPNPKQRLDERLLSFYNSVQGNTDIRHGYPPMHMHEAKQTIQADLLAIIGDDDKYLNGKMTNFKVDTRNQLRAELRQAITTYCEGGEDGFK